MVPIYALNAWLGLTFPEYAIYMDTCRECYEAYAIYNFMMFLLTYLDTEMESNESLFGHTHIGHIFPLCCLKPWPLGRCGSPISVEFPYLNILNRCGIVHG